MSGTAQTLQIVGGSGVLGIHATHGLEVVQAVRRGLPVSAVQFVIDSGRMTLAEVDRTILPRKTLSNRRKVGTLTAEQSDRLFRVARVLALAEETFGNKEKSALWLRRKTDIFSGESPLDLLDTDEGAREVETLLGRISHGIAA